MTMRTWIGATTVAAALIGMTASGARAEEKNVIEFNYGIPTGAYSQLYVAEDQGLFPKYGLKPKFFSFQSGAPLLAGLKSGSLDVITTGLASVFALGQGIPVKYIFYMGDASKAEALIARKGSDIKVIKDLPKAKQVGAAVGTCAQISLYWAAKAAGTTYSDLKTVNIAPPLYRNAFLGGSLDAGVAWGPYSLQLASVGEHLVGFDADWVPGGGTCPETTLVADAALKNKPELAKRLVQVQAEALELIAKNPQLAVDALAKRLSIPPDIAKLTFERYFKDPPTLEKHIDPKSRYALVGDGGLFAQLKLASETYVALGVLKEPIPEARLREAIDPQYVKAYLEKR